MGLFGQPKASSVVNCTAFRPRQYRQEAAAQAVQLGRTSMLRKSQKPDRRLSFSVCFRNLRIAGELQQPHANLVLVWRRGSPLHG